jgi:hypothetical protein
VGAGQEAADILADRLPRHRLLLLPLPLPLGFHLLIAAFTPPCRRAMGDAMLNHATGHTSACKPPFGAGAVARVVI